MIYCALGASRIRSLFLIILCLFSPIASLAGTVATVNFTGQFSPPSIGNGSHSRLVFDINNSLGAVKDIGFSVILPAGLTISPVPDIVNSCDGVLSATKGGSSIQLEQGRLKAGSNCSIELNIIANTIGAYSFDSTSLSFEGGSSPLVNLSLNVLNSEPTIRAAFTPMTIEDNTTSLLSFEIDSSTNTVAVSGYGTRVSLPTGLVVADPANPNNTCGGTLVVGDTYVDISGVALSATQTCQVDIDVEALFPGRFFLTSDDVNNGGNSAGRAVAELKVNNTEVSITRDILIDGVPVERVDNVLIAPPPRTEVAGLPVVTMSVAPQIPYQGYFELSINFDNTGNLLQSSNAFIVSIPDGVEYQIDAGSNCFFGAFASGQNLNIGSSFITANQVCAIKALFRATKAGAIQFNSSLYSTSLGSLYELQANSEINPFVQAGGSFAIQYVLKNENRNSELTNVSFLDDLNQFVPGLFTLNLPGSNPCGAGSTLSGGNTIHLTSGRLAALEECEMHVEVQVPGAAPTQAYTSAPVQVTGDIDAHVAQNRSGTLGIQIAPFINFSKSFDTAIAKPLQLVQLDYTIQNNDIVEGFSDGLFVEDIGTVDKGISITPPAPGFCGPDSIAQLTTQFGEKKVIFSKMQINANAQCSFSLGLTMPDQLSAGTYVSESSELNGVLAGQTAVSGKASASIQFTNAVLFTQHIASGSVQPGDAVDINFHLQSTGDVPQAYTNIRFTEAIEGVLAGSTFNALPANDICGAGSQISYDGSDLVLSGGSLAAGASCDFTASLQTPSGTTGTFNLVSSQLLADGVVADIPSPATQATLDIQSDNLGIEFLQPQLRVGDSAVLELNFSNSDVASSKSIDLVILDFTRLPITTTGAILDAGNNSCNLIIQLQSNSIQLSSGTIPAGGSCTSRINFSPVAEGERQQSSTLRSSLVIIAGSARSTVSTPFEIVDRLELASNVAQPYFAGEVARVDYVLSNLTQDNYTGIAFSTNVSQFAVGASVLGVNNLVSCGTPSFNTTNGLAATGLSVNAGQSCTFSADIQIPADLSFGDYPLTNSEVTINGFYGAEASQAILPVRVDSGFSIDQAVVTVNEGSDAVNTGRFDIAEHISQLTLSANVGAVSINSDGSWFWQYTPADGPDVTQVTLTTVANRNANQIQTVGSFTLNVVDVAPEVRLTGKRIFLNNVSYDLGLAEIIDPGQDTATNYKVNWGDGSSTNYASLAVVNHVYNNTIPLLNITVDVTDEDGVHLTSGQKSLLNRLEVVFFDSFENTPQPEGQEE